MKKAENSELLSMDLWLAYFSMKSTTPKAKFSLTILNMIKRHSTLLTKMERLKSLSTPKSKPVVFFGSGPVAAATLFEFLIKHFEIHAVVTKPPAEHGHRSTPPVISVAEKNDISLYTPSNKAELSKLAEASSLPDVVGVVVDYGIIIPKVMIDYFDKGIVNSHFSLLPLSRGPTLLHFPSWLGTDLQVSA